MEAIADWGSVIFLAMLPGVFAAVVWSPILVSRRLRILFGCLSPTNSTAVGYLIVAVGLSIPFVIGVGVGTAGSTQSVDVANALLNVAVGITVFYLIGLPVSAVIGLPKAGIDWDPTGYGLGTWAVVVVATLLYVALFTVPIIFFAFLLALPTGSNPDAAAVGAFWSM